ncbi:MAG TPA: bifunctional glutamate N-acetyltransferase/amino-acid acetyltransferase ArgJ [Candidatus Ornithomonoglobus merdipullorum]|uniref:Arginine biosynthesis bifunctional protein ArgJ n=1 Tax=Candidatus Ornithomonoglobus merdipullorum TaxID=2840895 RepID=A0A9D1MDL7_9FIRM|nr:bifunctional glutamate N-acetyltransferase/amino-acid acetyltransferase ArgJ [Candidatus Ornithomonoglobus merdipullorum]
MYKVIDGGVCAAKGYRASGINCGLNSDKNKNDLALLVSDVDADTAAVYTQNKVKGAPVMVTKSHIEASGGVSRAVVMNSKNANTCNADGEEKAERMCRAVSERLGIENDKVLVASTGVIGQILPVELIENGMDELIAGLSYEGNAAAATAIMTTDTVKKEYAVEFELGGKRCVLGGMAKGSGMIHPNMATTLNFITTDAAVSSELLQRALSDIVKVTYNCLSIDGDTSTNDMIILQANGLAGNGKLVSEDQDFEVFKGALFVVMRELTKMLAKDGEGATKLVECNVSSAPDKDTAIIVAKSVIRSPLLKCAVFGEDANWGRVLCAIGYAEAEFDITKVDVDFESAAGTVAVCRNGAGVEFSEDEAKKVLSEDEIKVNVALNIGSESASAWGCDLTYDYVKINGDYRS